MSIVFSRVQEFIVASMHSDLNHASLKLVAGPVFNIKTKLSWNAGEFLRLNLCFFNSCCKSKRIAGQLGVSRQSISRTASVYAAYIHSDDDDDVYWH